MDELLHHCLRELAFDGDLGCNASRLKDFISEFYAHHSIQQNVDDVLCTFIWSLVVRQPTVRVGVVPEGVISEVYIAPQVSAKRKAKSAGEETVELERPTLQLVPDAAHKSLEELQTQHGDALRIAIEPEAIYKVITGSHVKYSKMSPMVYSALQLITRGRDAGISVVELGKQSKYDQKTCHYLVKQLTELDLVEKVRRGGVGTNFCIHRYFFDRSPSWQAIRNEETQAEGSEGVARKSKQILSDTEDQEFVANKLEFSAIDSRHLSSLPLVRGRVVKLLKGSSNHIHPSLDLITAIGFSNPTRTDRRFFQTRIRELIQEGVVEKVVVAQKGNPTGGGIKCLRLVEGGKPRTKELLEQGGDDEGVDAVQSGIKTNVTIHKQIVDLLEESDVAGMTLADLSVALDNFDKRTIELLLTRAEKIPPPPHLSDLGIVDVMETSGRERRHRYFTVAAYHKLLLQESLEQPSVHAQAFDTTHLGDFLPLDPKQFFDSGADLTRFQDSLVSEVAHKPTARPQGRPRKYPVNENGMVDLGNGKFRKVTYKRKSAAIEREETSEVVDVDQRPAKKRRVDIESETLQDSVTALSPPAVSAPPSKKRGRPKKGSTSQADATSTTPSKKRTRFQAEEAEAVIPLVEKPVRGTKVKPGKEGKNKAPDESSASRRTRASKKPDSRPKHDNAPDRPPDIPVHASEIAIATGGREVLMSDSLAPTRISTESLPPSPKQRQVHASTPAYVSSSSQATSFPEIEHAIPIDPSLLAEEGAMNMVTPGLLDTLQPNHPLENGPANLDDSTGLIKTGQSSVRSKVNVSHMRRENEVLRVINELGGIANVNSKEFTNAHMSLIETLAGSGQPTSAPIGTRVDKRTMTQTLEALESRGRIKQLKTAVASHIGAQRPTCVAYIPDIEQTKLNQFLINLSQSIPVPPEAGHIIIKEAVDIGPSSGRSTVLDLPFRLIQADKKDSQDTIDQADQLFSYDEAVIRDVLLTERTTLTQLHGYIEGRVARARKLHDATISALESRQSLPSIVSHEHGIVHLTFFTHQLPLGVYATIVSCLVYDEQLLDLTTSEAARRDEVQNVSPELQATLQLGKPRARSRILDVLGLLTSLSLVVPLEVTTPDNASVICHPNGSHPGAYNRCLSTHGEGLATCPQYWKFNSAAPIYRWASEEPTFWREFPTRTQSEVKDYWAALRDVCLGGIEVPTEGEISSPVNSTLEPAVIRHIRRPGSWDDSYHFTWHQTRYMKRFTDVSTNTTPLQDEDGGSNRVKRIAWVISAPEGDIKRFYAISRQTAQRQMEKLEKRLQATKAKKKEKLDTDSRAALAQKAAEAKAQREADWTNLLAKVHPDPPTKAASTRLRVLRNRFLQAGSVKDVEKWKGEILDAVRQAEIAVDQAFSVNKRSIDHGGSQAPAPVLPQRQTRPVEKSVLSLISQQGPPVPGRVTKKQKGKEKAVEEPELSTPQKPKRRQRFYWTREYEELAKDAHAIIRARCRQFSRVDWGAYEQVFPSAPRNTIRQRLTHVRENPAEDAYLTRLEESWLGLWTTHRGTSRLPDKDLLSPTNFDLPQQIEFLRQHIDKNALRVGFVQAKQTPTVVIPSTFGELVDTFDIVESKSLGPQWDFMWQASVEDEREKRLLRQAFVRNPTTASFAVELSSEAVSVAESAVKMVLGTPNSQYDAEQGSLPLLGIDGDSVHNATKRLLERGVLAKLNRDPKSKKPGRPFKISEINQNALGGSISRDAFNDAVALDELTTQDRSWREWPLLATDGDNVALIQLVSDNAAEFRVDTTQAQSARPELDWNSKKADDDQIETTLQMRLKSSILPKVHIPDGVGPAQTHVLNSPKDSHGTTETGDMAYCSLQDNAGVAKALVTCSACLDEGWAALMEDSSETAKADIREILRLVRESGQGGISIKTLKLSIENHVIADTIVKMTRAQSPKVFWTGYAAPVLVSMEHVNQWSVPVREDPHIRIFPRRWYDIAGNKLVDVWDAALRAVMGVIVFRPGIPQVELRWRLRSVYDRQEFYDVLRFLLQEGFIRPRCDARMGLSELADVVLDEEEETKTFWFVREDRHWYQVSHN